MYCDIFTGLGIRPGKSLRAVIQPPIGSKLASSHLGWVQFQADFELMPLLAIFRRPPGPQQLP